MHKHIFAAALLLVASSVQAADAAPQSWGYLAYATLGLSVAACLLNTASLYLCRSELRHFFRRCDLHLRCEVSETGAPSEDSLSALQINAKAKVPAHQRMLQCFIRNGKCRCLPGRDFYWQQVLPESEKLEGLRLTWSDPGKEHLVDRDGLVPGIYYFDAKARHAILARLREAADVHGIPTSHEVHQQGQSSEQCATARGTERYPLRPSRHSTLPSPDDASVASQRQARRFLLLTVLLAAPAAKADTCDIVAGGLIRSYEGVTLGADQLGAVGTLQFSGDVLTIYPSPRTFSSARTQPAGDWDVAVSFGGDLIVGEHCKVAYLTMLAGQTHWRLTCPAVARVSATHIGGAK